MGKKNAKRMREDERDRRGRQKPWTVRKDGTPKWIERLMPGKVQKNERKTS